MPENQSTEQTSKPYISPWKNLKVMGREAVHYGMGVPSKAVGYFANGLARYETMTFLDKTIAKPVMAELPSVHPTGLKTLPDVSAFTGFLTGLGLDGFAAWHMATYMNPINIAYHAPHSTLDEISTFYLGTKIGTHILSTTLRKWYEHAEKVNIEEEKTQRMPLESLGQNERKTIYLRRPRTGLGKLADLLHLPRRENRKKSGLGAMP